MSNTRMARGHMEGGHVRQILKRREPRRGRVLSTIREGGTFVLRSRPHKARMSGRDRGYGGGTEKHRRYWWWVGSDGEQRPLMAKRHRPIDGRAEFHPDVRPDPQVPVQSSSTQPRPWEERKRRRARNRRARASRKVNR